MSKRAHRSKVTTHVLDTSLGRPAAGIPVILSQATGSGAHSAIAEATTDDDGRVNELGPEELPPGNYRLRFDTSTYFDALERECFFPEVVVSFILADEGHYHVPVLLSPFAYSTYRGS